MNETRPRSKTIASDELAAIKASVERAWNRLMLKMNHIHKSKRLQQKPVDPAIESIRQTDRKNWTQWLKSKAGQREILAAAKDGNVDYFLELSWLMSDEWLKLPIHHLPKLDVFLFSHWAEKRDGLPELFYLGPSDLTQACIQHLGDDSLDQEQVVKARQRLGLKAFRRFKIHPKYGPGGLVFPNMDK